jgi:hypothetical protein
MLDTLRDGFEARNYEVSEVSENRGLYRVAILEEDASAAELNELVTEAVDGDPFAIDVSSETTDGGQVVSTVVSFRVR